MLLTILVASFSESRNVFFESMGTSEKFNVRDHIFFALEIVKFALLSKEISEIKKY